MTVGKIRQTNHLEETIRLLSPLRLAQALELWSQLNIATDGHPGIQGWGLKNHASIRTGLGNCFAIDGDRTLRWLHEAGDEPEQCCLAAPRGSGKTNKLPRLNHQVNARQGLDLGVLSAKELPHSINNQTLATVFHLLCRYLCESGVNAFGVFSI